MRFPHWGSCDCCFVSPAYPQIYDHCVARNFDNSYPPPPGAVILVTLGRTTSGPRTEIVLPARSSSLIEFSSLIFRDASRILPVSEREKCEGVAANRCACIKYLGTERNCGRTIRHVPANRFFVAAADFSRNRGAFSLQARRVQSGEIQSVAASRQWIVNNPETPVNRDVSHGRAVSLLTVPVNLIDVAIELV